MNRNFAVQGFRWICCCLIFWTVGCVSVERQAERYQQLQPQRYVIVHPEGRQATAEYVDFAQWKSQQGYAVEWVSFDASLPPEQRFRNVSQMLKQLRPAKGESAYLLIAASNEELPMGPWQPAGTNLSIHSDLPLLAGREELGGPLERTEWEPAIRYPPQWICGRIPFEDAEVIATTLNSARVFHEKQGPIQALLGTERFAIANDSSMVMAGVRNDLKKLDWETQLFNEDWPREENLEEITVNLTITKREKKKKTVQKIDVDWSFIESWNSRSPDLVYVISHSSHTRETGGQKDYIGVGNKLLFPLAFMVWGDPNVNTWFKQRTPETPAIFCTTGCQMGRPDNGMLKLMASKGWAAAMITSTHNTSPMPLLAAIRAERSAPLYLAKGLTVGQSHYATMNAYLKDSNWDPVNWLLYPWAKKAKLQNVLGLTIYGDPSISLENRTSADDSLPEMHQQS